MNTKETQKDLNKKGILLLILLLIAILTGSYAITYSKYNSLVKLNSKTDVAKWKVVINDIDITNNEDLNLNEFIWDNSLSTAKDNTIAPGSRGYEIINITNSSDVDVTINIKIDNLIGNNDIPIKNNSLIVKPSENDFIIKKGENKTIKIDVEWINIEDGSNDLNDTLIAKQFDSIIIPVEVEASQVIERE